MKDIVVSTLSTPDELSQWDELVTASPCGSVFHYSWWLAAASREHQLLGAWNREGRLVGGIPLPVTRQFGLTLSRNPALSPYLGPLIKMEGDRDSYASISLMRQIGQALGEAITGFDSFAQHLGPHGLDVQGFLWTGFAARVSYTFVIEAKYCPQDVLLRMHPKHRSELAKAERRGIRVFESDEIDAFIHLNEKTFQRQGLNTPHDQSQVKAVWNTAHVRGHAMLLLARDANGIAIDGALLFMDARSSYLVLVGGDPDRRGDGGGNAVIWEGIKRSLLTGRAFDFEGSSIPGVESFYRRWGGIPQPTIYLQKSLTRRARFAMMLRDCLKSA